MYDVCILLLLTAFHLYINLVPATYDDLVNKQDPWCEKNEIKRILLLCFNTTFGLDWRNSKGMSWGEIKTVKNNRVS